MQRNNLKKNCRVKDYSLLSLFNIPVSLSPRTLEQNYGKVLSGVALSRRKALVGPGVELLRRSDLQGVVVLSLDGDMLVGDDELCVPEPGDGVLWRTFYSTAEEQSAADAGLQILRRQGHPQWICDGARQKCWDSETLPKCIFLSCQGD